MAKLKSFEEYIANVDSAEEIENTEVALGEPSELEDQETVTSDDQEDGGELGREEVAGEDAGEEAEDMEAETTPGEEDEIIDGEVVDTEPKDISSEIEDEMEEPSDVKAGEIEESVVNEEDSEESKKTVAEMLKEAYESACSEAKVWEEDMHDEHTVESYLKENAALVATLAMNALKEMREEMTLEMYEAACEELKESYSKKMDELKEAWTAEGEEVEEVEDSEE